MSVYEFRLRPESAWSTPWHADTLWGSLCWAWLDLGGREELTKLLAAFGSSKPPFVISDALPAGLLPYPVGAKPFGYEEGKKVKTIWCKSDDFRKWSSGELSDMPAPGHVQRPFSVLSRWHVRENRKTGMGDDGGLFQKDEYSFHAEAFTGVEGHLFSVFVRVLAEEENELLSPLRVCFERLGQKGFGGRASSGMGFFALEGEPQRREWLEVKGAQTGFVSLSHFVPAKNDPRDGCWKLHVKNPKFASNLVPGFLKGNLVTLAAGASFRVGGDLREFYGRMIRVGRDQGFEDALHYGLAFVAPMTRTA